MKNLLIALGLILSLSNTAKAADCINGVQSIAKFDASGNPVTSTNVISYAFNQFSVYASNTCNWTVTVNAADASWLFVARSIGSTSGSIFVATTPNPGEARDGKIFIQAIGEVAVHQVDVHQDGNGTCTFTVSPAILASPYAGKEFTVTVTTQPGCKWVPNMWTAQRVAFSPSVRTGPGTTVFTVNNHGIWPSLPPIDSYIFIGGQPIHVTQP